LLGEIVSHSERSGGVDDRCKAGHYVWLATAEFDLGGSERKDQILSGRRGKKEGGATRFYGSLVSESMG